MTTYGVVPEGYSRKPLARILADIEAKMITEFGPGVIQSPQSPLGQLNGMFADLAAELWELNEDVYQSYDPDQAEGTRLDTLAKLRLLYRALGEQDPDFRRAITNQDRARIDIPDIIRAIAGLDGVTYVQVFVNGTAETDDNLIPPGHVCVAVLGGSDDEIASTIRRFIVPGISTFGNVYVTTQVEGYCRSMAILRPILIPVKLNIKVRVKRDANGCPPPSPLTIRDGLLIDFAGSRKLINGDDIDFFRIRSAIESRFPNVEVISFTGERDEIQGGYNEPVVIGFIELATVAQDDVTVEVV